jgi:hypothetical protein
MEEIQCTGCNAPISAAYYNTQDPVPCPSCGVPIKIEVFPAFFSGVQPLRTGETLIDDQAGCFYHPQKKAVIPCAFCGRFLCSLCDVEWGGEHLCPACLESGKKKGRIVNLERHRVLYDALALKLSIYPIVMFWFTLFSSPVALYLAIRHWNSPGSIVGRTKTRFVTAIILSGLQVLAWMSGITYIVSRRW